MAYWDSLTKLSSLFLPKGNKISPSIFGGAAPLQKLMGYNRECVGDLGKEGRNQTCLLYSCGQLSDQAIHLSRLSWEGNYRADK